MIYWYEHGTLDVPFANINNSKQYSSWVSKYRYLTLFLCELHDLSLVDPLKHLWYVATFAQTFRSRCQQKPGIGQSFVTCEIWQIFKRSKRILTYKFLGSHPHSAVRVFEYSGIAVCHTCKKRVIPVIYHRNFFWIFRKILGWECEINTAPKPSPEVAPSKMEVAPF